MRLCDKHLAERSVELSGAICLKALVLLRNDPSQCCQSVRERLESLCHPHQLPKKNSINNINNAGVLSTFLGEST